MYETNESLPASIRNSLPEAAMELYRAAYNRVWESLSAAEPQGAAGVNTQAHEAALLVVKEKYSQDENCDWNFDPVGDHMKHQGEMPEDDN